MKLTLLLALAALGAAAPMTASDSVETPDIVADPGALSALLLNLTAMQEPHGSPADLLSTISLARWLGDRNGEDSDEEARPFEPALDCPKGRFYRCCVGLWVGFMENGVGNFEECQRSFSVPEPEAYSWGDDEEKDKLPQRDETVENAQPVGVANDTFFVCREVDGVLSCVEDNTWTALPHAEAHSHPNIPNATSDTLLARAAHPLDDDGTDCDCTDEEESALDHDLDWFLTFPLYSRVALSEATPYPYTLVYADYNATAIHAPIATHTLDSYSAADCASYCNAHPACRSFGVFVERQPSCRDCGRDEVEIEDVEMCELYNVELERRVARDGARVEGVGGGRWYTRAVRGSNGYNKGMMGGETATVTATVSIGGGTVTRTSTVTSTVTTGTVGTITTTTTTTATTTATATAAAVTVTAAGTTTTATSTLTAIVTAAAVATITSTITTSLTVLPSTVTSTQQVTTTVTKTWSPAPTRHDSSSSSDSDSESSGSSSDEEREWDVIADEEWEW